MSVKDMQKMLELECNWHCCCDSCIINNYCNHDWQNEYDKTILEECIRIWEENDFSLHNSIKDDL